MNNVIVGVGIAVAGWLVTHFSRLHFEKRSARLDRVNEQLGKLYGPLLATLTATDTAWEAFSEKHWPIHGLRGYFGEGSNTPTEEELARWRNWMTNVFHPLNEQIETTIIRNIHLIEGEEIPECFTAALAHVSAYRAVITQWQTGDYSEHVSVNNWPASDLMNSVKPVFQKLAHEQSQLLGR